MTNKAYRTELSEGGYEKIEARIQKIENLANNGIFAEESRNSRFYQIVSEVKKLRQTLRDALVIVENTAVQNVEGGAA